MSIRFLAVSALLATGWLGMSAAHAQSQTPYPAPGRVTASQPKMVLMPYAVADLVTSKEHPWATLGDEKAPAEDRLVALIQGMTALDSWAKMGGQGTIDYFPKTQTILVNQTAEVQEQVADLLANSRRLQDMKVALDVRFVTVPQRFFETKGVDFEVTEAQNHPPGFINDFQPDKFLSGLTPAGPRPPVAPTPRLRNIKSSAAQLSDGQVIKFLKAVQSDEHFVQMDKVTAANGRILTFDAAARPRCLSDGTVQIVDGTPVLKPGEDTSRIGRHLSVRPVAWADGRNVELALKIDEIDKTVTIPDGGTVLLGGLKRETEVRHEDDTPILSRVPYVNRLFKNVGYGRETQMVYVLVTPRIVVHEEEDWPPYQTVVKPNDPKPLLSELLQAYDEACAADQKKDATRFARAARTIDPTCFAKRHER